MKIINSENNKSLIFPKAQSPCAIMLINLKGSYIYLLMGLNDYLGLLTEVNGATSISTILLVDVKVESFSPYIYVHIPWAKHTKTTVRGALVWQISDVVNYIFFLLLLPPCFRSHRSSASTACVPANFRRRFGELFWPPRTSLANSASTPRFVSSFSSTALLSFCKSVSV
jgi:hypothetical protein